MFTDFYYGPTLFVIGWLIFAGVAGYIAYQRGRSVVLFVLLSIILSPLVGIIAAIMVKPGKGKEGSKL